uniref:Uncharacterized protein n=1 Tax=Auxenochlorella protothecoides TaxID=3075 RepID=A0A1D2A629_AUXPR
MQACHSGPAFTPGYKNPLQPLRQHPRSRAASGCVRARREEGGQSVGQSLQDGARALTPDERGLVTRFLSGAVAGIPGGLACPAVHVARLTLQLQSRASIVVTLPPGGAVVKYGSLLSDTLMHPNTGLALSFVTVPPITAALLLWVYSDKKAA